jgi:biopolymer transport protein TolR
MGMGGGGKGGAVSEINVTPLIDVLLVLLIIFMVIVPVVPKGLNKSESEPNDRTIVVQVLFNGGAATTYKINETDVAKAELEQKLVSIYATRQEKVMFVKGDKDLDFSKVAEVIDLGHQAGVDNIGMITPKIEAGQ